MIAFTTRYSGVKLQASHQRAGQRLDQSGLADKLFKQQDANKNNDFQNERIL